MVQFINARTPLEDARAVLRETYDLRFTRTVQKATDSVFQRIKSRISESEWSFCAPLIFEINRQKRIRDAVVLAHHYQLPQIVHGVADIVGDSPRLAIEASKTEPSLLVVCGVTFMAETVKLLNAGKHVLIPDSRASCPSASSITPADVLAMRAQHPGVPVLAYVASSAAVKAVSDICCTSSNAADIINALEGDTVIMVPDQFIAQNAARRTKKRIITWAGISELHGAVTAARIAELREAHPMAKVVAHAECPPEVIDAVDFSGSNGALINWIKIEKPAQVVVVAEGSLADNLASAVPDTELVRGCGFSANMKRINLENILWALHSGTEEIELEPEIADPAERVLRRMLDFVQNGTLAGPDPEPQPPPLPPPLPTTASGSDSAGQPTA